MARLSDVAQHRRRAGQFGHPGVSTCPPQSITTQRNKYTFQKNRLEYFITLIAISNFVTSVIAQRSCRHKQPRPKAKSLGSTID